MKKRKKRLLWTTIILLGLLLVLAVRSREAFNISNAEGSGDVNVNSSYYYLPVGSYDSADTAILKSVDSAMGTVTLFNTVNDKSYTLNYDGTTYVSDKYGTAMSMAQLKEGMIVNVNFFKATRQLVDIQISPDAWSYESVTKYNLGGLNSTASIGDRTYALTKGVQVFSQGQQADLMNIVDGDAITVSGIGYDIYSITVDSGHGYVRLTNDEALVGGWIEIGNELITKVAEEGMLLTVPEGSYTVRMYNDNSSVTQDIIVDRNQEVILDCQGVTAPVETIGRILFNITPENAFLKLDGEVVNTSGIVKAEYGIHQIEVSAPGYDTLSRYINVGTDLAEIAINLDESVAYVSGNSNPFANDFTNTNNGTSDNKTQPSGNSTSGNKSTSGNSTSGNNKKPSTTTGINRVYISYPDNVEVYVDGIYQGLTPMSFKKIAGSHTIILKKNGYITKSYTIYLYDDGDDISISFSALEEEAPQAKHETVVKPSEDAHIGNNSDSNSNSNPVNNTGNTETEDNTDNNTDATDINNTDNSDNTDTDDGASSDDGADTCTDDESTSDTSGDGDDKNL